MADYDIFREQLAIKYPSYGHALLEPSPRKPDSPVQVSDFGCIRRGNSIIVFSMASSVGESWFLVCYRKEQVEHLAAEQLAMEQGAAELAETPRELAEANAALQLAHSAGRAAARGGPIDVGEEAGAEARAAGGDQSRSDREWQVWDSSCAFWGSYSARACATPRWGISSFVVVMRCAYSFLWLVSCFGAQLNFFFGLSIEFDVIFWDCAAWHSAWSDHGNYEWKFCLIGSMNHACDMRWCTPLI
jgi:hypothetical protein